MEEKGLTNLPQEVFAQVKQDLLDRIEDRVNAMIVRKLPPEQLEEFENILDTGKEKDIQSFCAKHIPNLEEAVAAELMNFRDTYLR